MLKKVLTYIFYFFLISLIGVYFWFARSLSNIGSAKEKCNNIKITLLDSAVNRFVTGEEVESIVTNYMGELKGKRKSQINLATIEQLLNQRSAIKKSQVYLYKNGELQIDITQRKPIIRIQTPNGGFYVDETQYVFPLSDRFSSYVPIVSGNIPLNFNSNHRGKVSDDYTQWLPKILELGLFLNKHPEWDSQIEQIYIDNIGDVIFAPRLGNHKIIFGDLNEIEEKFEKLNAFYKNILPTDTLRRYKIVNLKYKNQIVCKL